jgi:hypothetical protein
VKIDFCEADVLDVFDEWRRASGDTTVISRQSSVISAVLSLTARQSLPAHSRARRLSADVGARRAVARREFDALIDRVSTRARRGAGRRLAVCAGRRVRRCSIA